MNRYFIREISKSLLFLTIVIIGSVFFSRVTLACNDYNGHNVCENYKSYECTGSGPWTQRSDGSPCSWCSPTDCSWVVSYTSDCGGCTTSPPTPPDKDSQCTATSFPRAIVPGGTANVSVTMKNTGLNTWTPGDNYRLGSANPYNNSTFGVARAFMAGGSSVATDNSYTFNFTLTAPVTQGTYSSKWQMLREWDVWFGATCGPDTLYVAPRPTCTGVTTTLSPTTFEGAGPTVRMWASGVSPTVDALWFPTWSTDVSGWDASSPPKWTSQDDLVWHVGTNAGGGSWYADIPMPSHHFNGATYDLGRVQTDVWMHTPIWDCSPGNCTYCGGVAHNRVAPGPPVATIRYTGWPLSQRSLTVVGNTQANFTTVANGNGGALNNTETYRRYWYWNGSAWGWSTWLNTSFTPASMQLCSGIFTDCTQLRAWYATANQASGTVGPSGDIALGSASNPRTQTWQIVVNATRNDGRWCSGNPDAWGPSPPTSNRCDPTNLLYDYVWMTLAPPQFVLSGNLKQGTDCTAATNLTGYQAGSVVRATGTVTYQGAAGSPFNITIGDGNQTINSVCGALVPPANTAYTLLAACSNGTPISISGGCATGLNNNFFSNPTINLVYRIDNARPWTTSLDGDVYIGGGTTMTVPTATLNTFDGYLIDNVGVGGFAFSNGTLDVLGTSRISQSPGSYGYYFGLAAGLSGMWPSNYTAILNVPAGAVPLANFASPLNPASVYTITQKSLNTLLTVPVTYSLTTDGVVVVYVTNDPTGVPRIMFGNPFQSNSASRRILFITNFNVIVDGALITPGPVTTASPATIQAGLVTTGRISLPQKVGWAVGNYDSPIVMEGPALASTAINMLRDAGPTGNLYPPLVVRHYPRTIYYLTQRERLSNSNFTGLFTSNVTWTVN